jgi:hypothetical protein
MKSGMRDSRIFVSIAIRYYNKFKRVILEALTVVSMKTAVFWVVGRAD